MSPGRTMAVGGPMPDDDAFLRAIIANPDDDLPRLVYADWLDEHGEPERAEFIRVQCELAGVRGDMARFEKLFTRSEQLLAVHRPRWLGPLADLVEHATFLRGFVIQVTLPAAAFLVHADAIWHLAPVQRVKLKDAWE